jgi:hypothetical protein
MAPDHKSASSQKAAESHGAHRILRDGTVSRDGLAPFSANRMNSVSLAPIITFYNGSQVLSELNADLDLFDHPRVSELIQYVPDTNGPVFRQQWCARPVGSNSTATADQSICRDSTT